MNRDYLKLRGIFPTPPSIVSYICKDIDFDKYSKILEPGFGTGNFIYEITNQNKNKSTIIFATETEKKFYNDAIKKWNNKNIILSNSNYLTDFNENNFDLIIGNPPYGSKISDQEMKYICKNKNIFIENSNESLMRNVEITQ